MAAAVKNCWRIGSKTTYNLQWNKMTTMPLVYTYRICTAQKSLCYLQIKIKCLQIQHGFCVFTTLFPVQLFLYPCMQCWPCLQFTSKTQLCRWHIILSTSSLISHWGILCVGVFEIICERFLNCYHTGNNWHCPKTRLSMGLFVLAIRNNSLSVCLYVTCHRCSQDLNICVIE